MYSILNLVVLLNLLGNCRCKIIVKINILFLVQDAFPDKATERKILSLAIKCSSTGCTWTGELRQKQVYDRLFSHLMIVTYCVLNSYN